MGREWIESKDLLIASAGWATLGGVVAITDDAELDLATLKRLLQRVEKTVHRSPDLVRHQMNSFVISVGSYVRPLTETALQVGEAIGPVTADLGDTSRQVPFAPDYIRKVEKRGSLGKKRKTVKC